MVYDDPDAGMDYEIIRIDKRTHDTIVKAQKRHQPLTGTLKITKPYESVEYIPDLTNITYSPNTHHCL